VEEKQKKKREGHRIDYFIHAMRQCGCRFDSGQHPLFSKRGVLEFWEGGFFYKPGGIDITGKVTLDHNFITVKLQRVIPREAVRKFREEIHLLMTANQCHYYFEALHEDEEKAVLILSKYISASTPPQDEVQVVLDMLAHAVFDVQRGLKNGFQDWVPRFRP
jgi:hypothetical protein